MSSVCLVLNTLVQLIICWHHSTKQMASDQIVAARSYNNIHQASKVRTSELDVRAHEETPLRHSHKLQSDNSTDQPGLILFGFGIAMRSALSSMSCFQ